MFCRNCGLPMDDGAAFCGRCGTPVACEPGLDGESPAPVEEITAPPVKAPATPVEAPVNPMKVPVAPVRLTKEPGNGMGITGMVLGIVSCVLGVLSFSCNSMFSGSFMGMALGIVGLILSICAMRKARAAGSKNAYALVGLITAIVGLCLSLLFGIWFLLQVLFVLMYYAIIIIAVLAEGASPVLGPSVPM